MASMAASPASTASAASGSRSNTARKAPSTADWAMRKAMSISVFSFTQIGLDDAFHGYPHAGRMTETMT